MYKVPHVEKNERIMLVGHGGGSREGIDNHYSIPMSLGSPSLSRSFSFPFTLLEEGASKIIIE